MSKENEQVALVITDKYLEELLNFSAAKIVGKCMKRIELLGENEILKKEIKELLYENYRDLKDLILAYNKGFEMKQFKFKPKDSLAQ